MLEKIKNNCLLICLAFSVTLSSLSWQFGADQRAGHRVTIKIQKINYMEIKSKETVDAGAKMNANSGISKDSIEYVLKWQFGSSLKKITIFSDTKERANDMMWEIKTNHGEQPVTVELNNRKSKEKELQETVYYTVIDAS